MYLYIPIINFIINPIYVQVIAISRNLKIETGHVDNYGK